MDIRSRLAGGEHRADVLTQDVLPELVVNLAAKFYWFEMQGYRPHIYQAAFHGAQFEGVLARFRHLVAGRRGGKTLSAAWETLFYATNPKQFHLDAHGVESDRPLWIWALAKDYKLGRPSLVTFLETIRQAGLVKDKDFRYNKTERIFEFYSSSGDLLSTVEFKTADDPQNLRGAGLDILWIDEAAFITTQEAWDVVFPSLADKVGIVLTTTTPKGKNWFHELFFTERALRDPNQARVQYTSLDNPYFSRKQWDYYMLHYHGVQFKQEFMASFDALMGIALHGDWLKFYVTGNPDVQSTDISIKPYRTEDGSHYNLRVFLGVDPAISLSDRADHFCIAAVGITQDNTQGFLLDYLLTRAEFPDQLDIIREWFLKWRPQYIGIESNAFQAALAQMASRMEGLPGIVPVMNTGRKKNDRILSLGPLFKIGKIRIHNRHREFIDQWVSFNPELKNQKDDLLDAVEIALGVAGVLLPSNPSLLHFEDDRPVVTMEDEARAQLNAMRQSGRKLHPLLGSEV